jgi:hypothetical protein
MDLAKSALLSALPGLKLWTDQTDEADEKSAELGDTLEELAVSAKDDEEAAKQLGEAYKLAFDLAQASADAFDKRVAELVPAIGKKFDGIDFGLVDVFKKDQDAIDAAAEGVLDAQDRLKDARERLKDANVRDIKSIRRDIAEAQRDIVTAQQKLADTQKGKLEEGFETTLAQNLTALEGFISNMSKLEKRFAGIGGESGEALEEALLAHLASLGPGAVPLLKDLVNLSDKELAALSDKFGRQIQLAKRAADFEFDKYPKNFAEKIGRARDAAVAPLEDLVGQFDALVDHADPSGAFGKKMDELALAMQAMADSGLIALSDVERGFLDTALEAETAELKAAALKSLIASLKGKTLPIDVAVNDKALSDFLERIRLSTERPPVLNILVQPLLDEPTGTPSKQQKKNTQDTLEDIFGIPTQKRHSGGPVSAGKPYLWKPDEELLVTDRDAQVVTKKRAAAAAPAPKMQHFTIEIPVVMPDGRVLAQASASFTDQELVSQSKARS